MLQQPLQQKQITNSKRLILAGRRHMASRARESGKDFAGGAFAVPIEGGVERGRTTLGDRLRDPSRMLIRRRGFWLGSAHGAASANQATVAGVCVAALSKSAKSTHKSRCGFRQLDAAHGLAPKTISHDIAGWRATVDEDGQYCFAVAL